MTTERRAHAIMGANFLGPELGYRYFGTQHYSTKRLASVPFDEGVLEQSRDTHLLVAGTPVTLCDLLARYPESFMERTKERTQRDPLYRQRVLPRWYLLQREPDSASLNLSHYECWDYIDAPAELPRACEVIYAVLLKRLHTGEELLSKFSVRCEDNDQCGDTLCIGQRAGLLSLRWAWGGEHILDIGAIAILRG